jgi:type IV pilus assembly protein PilC
MNKGTFKNLKRNLRISFIHVSLNERVLFAKHLSMMIKSGMTEVESVRLLRSQVKSSGFGFILDEVISEVENGKFISAALKPFQKIFGELFINIIELGETSGTLSENLDFLSKELREAQHLRGRIRAAMIYPIILLVASIGVTLTLIFTVLPKIVPIFTRSNIKLPMTTRILINITNFVTQNWQMLLGGTVVFLITFILLMRIKTIRYGLHRIILFLPLAGKLSKNYNMANFTRTLSILLRSGIRIVQALSTSSNITTNLVYKRKLEELAERTRMGEQLYEYMEKHENLFPGTTTRMIQVGEKTGNLDDNLMYLADFYKNEVDETVKNLSSVLEPILLVFMGGIVAFVAISIITPIYGLTQTIQ